MRRVCVISSVLIGILLVGNCLSLLAQPVVSKVELIWRPASSYDGKDNLELDLVLKNRSAGIIALDGADLWFNAILPIAEKKTDVYELSEENGNLFRIRFEKGVRLAASDSLIVTYTSRYPIFNVSSAPNGFYFQDRRNPAKVESVNLILEDMPLSDEARHAYWATLYDKNHVRQASSAKNLILPSPKSLKTSRGQLLLQGEVGYNIDPAFESEQPNFDDFAKLFGHITFVPRADGALVTIRKAAGYGREAYSLQVGKKGIVIEATEPAGVFYALQTLRSALGASALQNHTVHVPYMEVDDEPRYAYRGYMMDIARNFKDKKVILKYIDLMSHYKLNTFHLHFIDDEGWRIEIAALPELTEIGANRTPLFAQRTGIQPSYGSGAVSTAKDYLSRQDFIDILRYAKQRHITVVPEIETPGHARASIKAMEVRYQRYMAKGNKAEAERYLLHDFDDKSVYSSAQYWNDNVMNVALPSVYDFLSVVLDEIKGMYVEAGVELKKVSLGGDEVPVGAWEKSPKIRSLMDSLGMSSVHEVWPYYITKINELCRQKGLQLAGWEEMGMVNDGTGMKVNGALASANIQLDVWNNLIGGGQEDLAYRLANAGYPTVFISANNNYFDMAWDTHFEEPGLKWATYADLYQSFTFLPEHFFANIHHSVNGAKYEKGFFADKVRLSEKGKANLLGIKGGLWSETVVSEERLDYMMFPRFFSLAERAWAPQRPYENDFSFDIRAFNKDYSAFLNKVSLDELPKIASTVRYRLPAVGVKEEGGRLLANAEYPGFKIYYTTDGSMPTSQSAVYTRPLTVERGTTYRFAVIDQDGRRGTVSLIRK